MLHSPDHDSQFQRDQGLRQASAPHSLILLLFGIGCGAGFLTWCHRGKHIPLPTLAAHDYDVTYGGGLADRCGRRWYT